MSGAPRMAAGFFDQPAFSVFEPALRERLAALAHFPAPHELRALTQGMHSALEPWFDFALQDDDALEIAGGYDALIAQSSRIPTRAGSFHDLLGALVWLHFPALKTAIHRVHLAAKSAERGPRENAATHLDESGILVVSTDTRVFEALADLKWRALFWEQRRELADSTRFLAFGHGLLDAFRAPHPRLMSKALCVHVKPEHLALSAPALRSFLDHELALSVPEFLLEPGRLLPLPVLGVPGWAPQQQNAEFYGDQSYFRPERSRARELAGRPWLELY